MVVRVTPVGMVVTVTFSWYGGESDIQLDGGESVIQLEWWLQ